MTYKGFEVLKKTGKNGLIHIFTRFSYETMKKPQR
jgi:hypothetical protein